MLGASPRGSLAIQRAARALAASHGRAFVVPDDVKRVFPAVIEHRVLIAPDAQLRGVTSGDVVEAILAVGAGAGRDRQLTDRAPCVAHLPFTVALTRRGWSLVGAALGLVVGSFLLGTIEMLILGSAAFALLAVVTIWLAARPRPDLAVRRQGEARPALGGFRRPDRPAGREPGHDGYPTPGRDRLVRRGSPGGALPRSAAGRGRHRPRCVPRPHAPAGAVPRRAALALGE